MSNTEEKYWRNFYKNKHINTPTTFAKFVLKYLRDNYPQYNSIVELGCGNGRDTYYFGKKGYKIIGIDSAIQPKNKDNSNFQLIDLNNLFLQSNNYDIVYSRCFVHSISNIEICKLLKWTKNLFIAEFRAEEDEPILYKNHYRNKINGSDFIKKLINYNYDILYYIKAKNLAKYKNENPIIIRIIAKRKQND